MKGKTLLMINLILLLSSCSDYNNKGRIFSCKSHKAVFFKRIYPILKLEDNYYPVPFNDSIFKIGDTLRYNSFWLPQVVNVGAQKYYVLKKNENLYLIHEDNIMDYIDYQLQNIPPRIKIPKEKDKELWSKALNYIIEHSSMRIQTQTDLLIETYNTYEDDQTGYQISKMLDGNDIYYTIHGKGDNSVVNAKKMAYYLINGIELNDN
jgi:hypothetical protein